MDVPPVAFLRSSSIFPLHLFSSCARLVRASLRSLLPSLLKEREKERMRENLMRGGSGGNVGSPSSASGYGSLICRATLSSRVSLPPSLSPLSRLVLHESFFFLRSRSSPEAPPLRFFFVDVRARACALSRNGILFFRMDETRAAI